MLNEFKRPMWTDGPAKQPWLNYYNSYERMHSCFGDPGGDSQGGSGTETNVNKSTELSLADFEDYEGIGGKGSFAAEEADRAAKAGDAAAAEEASDRSQQGIDDYTDVEGTGFGGGYAGDGSFDSGLGYNELSDDFKYFEEVDRGIQARNQQIADEIVENQSALERDVNVTVDKEGNFVYDGKDAFSAFGDQAGKFGKTVAGGLVDMYKSTSVLGLIESVADFLNKPENEVTQADINSVLNNKGGNRSDQSPIAGPTTTAQNLSIAGPDINPILAGGATDFSSGGYDGPTINITNLPTLDELDLIKESRAEDDAMVNRSSSGFGDVRGYSSPSLPTLGGDFNAMQNQANLENIISAYEETERARSREGNQLGKDIAAYEDAETAMFGGRNAGQPEVMAFGPEVDQDDPRIIKPNQVVAAAAEPKKSAFNMLLDRINQPSTSYSSNVTTDTPMTQQDMTQQVMTTNPFEIAKQRARMARATLGNYNVNIGRAADALQSFEGNTDTITPFALATLMANQPKDSQTYNENIRKLGGRGPLQPTTFALGGGGLRSLMEYS